jgi:hypothetical protein
LPNTWTKALAAYRYPVWLSDYIDRNLHPGWFVDDLSAGDCEQTKRFEARFRKLGPANIEAWFEVVYWKLYSQPLVRNGTTRTIFEGFKDRHIGSNDLHEALSAYVAAPSRDSFNAFRALFGFHTSVIAIVATFPAFQDPETHPMVDTRIAKWVEVCMKQHNAVDPNGPQLTKFPLTGTVLTMSAFDAFQDWRQWCIRTARKLSAQTHTSWRARDVEMAVFHACGGRSGRHPAVHLNPLSPV